MPGDPEDHSKHFHSTAPQVVLSDEQKEMAALYASGALTKDEREIYEAELESNGELLKLTIEFLEIASQMLLSSIKEKNEPKAESRKHVLQWVDAARRVPDIVSNVVIGPLESIVVTDPLGRVAWVSQAFCEMCGYSIEELRGKKPGSLLQGRRTDPTVVARIRGAIGSQISCKEQLFNYHKLGREYLVSIQIDPVIDPSGQLVAFLAIEQELPEESARAVEKR